MTDSLERNKRNVMAFHASAMALVVVTLAGTPSVALQEPDADHAIARHEEEILSALRERLPPLTCRASVHGFSGPRTEGKRSFLLFWAPWCVPCKPVMDELAKLRDQDDIAVATVSQAVFDEPSREDAGGMTAVRKFLARHELKAPTCVYGDPAQRKAWHAEGIPVLFLFGPSGAPEQVAMGGDRGVALARRVLSGWRPNSP